MIKVKDVVVSMEGVPVSSLTKVRSTDGLHELQIILAKVQELMYLRVVLQNGMSCEKIVTVIPPVPEKLDVSIAIKLYKISGSRETHDLLKQLMRDGTLSQKVAFRAFIDNALSHNDLIVAQGSAGATDTRIVFVGGPGGLTFDLADVRYAEVMLKRVPGSIMFPDIAAYSIRAAEEEYW